jgi:site-specific DNA recombinase
MYEQESQKTSNRVKETLRTRAKKGLFKGSNPPLGYEVIEGTLHIRDDDTPNIVKRIFQEYLAGPGRDSIAKRLYNEGSLHLLMWLAKRMQVINGMIQQLNLFLPTLTM